MGKVAWRRAKVERARNQRALWLGEDGDGSCCVYLIRGERAKPKVYSAIKKKKLKIKFLSCVIINFVTPGLS